MAAMRIGELAKRTGIGIEKKKKKEPQRLLVEQPPQVSL